MTPQSFPPMYSCCIVITQTHTHTHALTHTQLLLIYKTERPALRWQLEVQRSFLECVVTGGCKGQTHSGTGRVSLLRYLPESLNIVTFLSPSPAQEKGCSCNLVLEGTLLCHYLYNWDKLFTFSEPQFPDVPRGDDSNESIIRMQVLYTSHPVCGVPQRIPVTTVHTSL